MPAREPPVRRLGRRLLRGPAGDPAWVRPALLALLAGTGVLYLWGLSASGWANSYYAAAVQAGATSWKAFFFGSFDGANFITVDKTPASMWIMALSVRLFGLNSWSMLAPQALEGVATVGVLYATVRRWPGPGAGRIAGPVAGLLAGVVAATTPVAVLMFRFNNPDALLVLLLTIGAYCVVRASETASYRWLLLCGVAVGFGFLAKMLQAFLLLPVFALVYLVTAPTSILRRLWHLLIAGLAVIVSAGWWVAIVELFPAKSRPYIGGSQNNSVLELTLGYNGLGRLTGNETGSVGGGRGWGEPGWLRLFGTDMGSQAAWLLPAALIMLVAGLACTLRTQRGDRERASYLLWGGWLLANGLTFSLMKGIVHAYYTVALAPAIGALVGIGTVSLWRRRSPLAQACLAVAAIATAWCAYDLLGLTPDWYPWLRPTIVVLAGLAAGLALVDAAVLGKDWLARRRQSPDPAAVAVAADPGVVRAGPRRLLLPAVAAALGISAGLAGPVAYSLQTAATAHTGALPSAGPGGGFGPGGHPGQGPGGRRVVPPGFGGQMPGGTAGQMPGGRARQLPGGQGPSSGQTRRNGRFADGHDGARGNLRGGFPGMPGGAGGTVPGLASGAGDGLLEENLRFGGPGGLLRSETPSKAVVAKLTENANKYTWVLATIGANNAAGYQLGTGKPVLAIGGFNGSDAAPTLAEFKRYVAEKRIHYFAGGGGMMRPDSGSNYGQQITNWVQQTFPAVTIDGGTFYDLTKS